MKFLRALFASALLLGAGVVTAASQWSFQDASLTVTAKQGAGLKDKLSTTEPLPKTVNLGAQDNLKIILTTQEDNKPKRPHQAFFYLKDVETGLETAFPFTVKENGKAKVELTRKDLPIQLLISKSPLRATVILASFGTSKQFNNHVFNLDVKLDPSASQPKYEKPLRYGKLAEINHIFKPDPKSPPVVISLFFVLAVLATIPVLLGTWAYLGANLSHLGKATSSAPISHILFFGSIVSMEGIFFLYYYNWSLFQMLPVAGVVGLVAFLSGSKALSEVQDRRVAGER